MRQQQGLLALPQTFSTQPFLPPATCQPLQVSWPLSIAAPEAALAQYQMVFRHIFELKWVERELTRVAAIYGQTTGLASRRARMRARRQSAGSPAGSGPGGGPADVLAESLALSYSTCQLMTHFFRQYLLYVTFEVMEPLWGAFERQLQTAGSLDEVRDALQCLAGSCREWDAAQLAARGGRDALAHARKACRSPAACRGMRQRAPLCGLQPCCSHALGCRLRAACCRTETDASPSSLVADCGAAQGLPASPHERLPAVAQGARMCHAPFWA